MKKLRCVLLILLVVQLIIVTGCSDNKSGEETKSSFINYATDMQITYKGGGTVTPMTKSDKGYYYIGDNKIIIFVDAKTKKATPLCSKPDCLHNNPDTCDAYSKLSENIIMDSLFGSLGTAIQYYDGSLYMVCGEYDESYTKYNTYLMKMDADGSNRENITGYLDFSITTWFIHQGYFYYTIDSSVMRIPVDSPKSKPETVYTVSHFTKDSGDTFKYTYAYKNYLYFTADDQDDEGNGKGRISICVNLDTMENYEIKVGDNYVTVQAFENDSLVMTYINDKDEKIYIKANLDGSNQQEVLKQSSAEIQSYMSDGTYFYFDNKSIAMDGNEEQIITVCDENFKKVDSFKLPPTDLAVYSFFCPQDENYFLLECYNEKNEHLLVMADKSQIGSIGGKTIQYTELCSLDWAGETDKPYVEE